ncbi:hypothetical protein R3P38DRAFT_3183770 [Favolaschia claudopus]|uniref:Uncharacterized protein n=1 Tax=Favolaschia claudopus TaxID=2862362 RepID=A0AAW0CCQ7_9AGAR
MVFPVINAERLEEVKRTGGIRRRGLLFPTGEKDPSIVTVPTTERPAVGPAGITFQYCFGLVQEVASMPIDMAIIAPTEWLTGVYPPMAVLHVDQNQREGHPLCMSVNDALNEGTSDASVWYGNVLVFPFCTRTGMLQSLPEFLDNWAATVAMQDWLRAKRQGGRLPAVLKFELHDCPT